MATQLQIRRGTSTQVAAFTGAEGEIVVNTTNDSVHVNDGSTAGGFEMARADLNNVSDTSLNAALTGNTVSALTITTLTLGATAITATGTELNLLDGVTATTAELNYVDGVTSNVQTQLDAKAPTANPTFTGSFTSPGIDDNADAIAITIDSSENVGIGTTSPSRVLAAKSSSVTVANFESTSGTAGLVSFSDSNTTNDVTVRAGAVGDNLVLQAGGSERLRITSAGAVAIGATSATARLEVTGAFGFASGANSLATTVSKAAARIRGSSDASTSLFFGSLTNDAEQYIQSSNGAGSAADDLALNPHGGNVGIGRIPRVMLDVAGEVAIAYNATYGLRFYNQAQNNWSSIGNNVATGSSSANLVFKDASGEAMRLDGSRNLLVGKTASGTANTGAELRNGSSNHAVIATSTSETPLVVNRKTNDGSLINLLKDGTTVGRIATWDGEIAIGRQNCALLFDDDTNRIKPHSVASNTVRDNALDLGGPSARFDDIYATNGTIQTSDRNEKQDIEALTDAEQRVAVAAKGLLRKFRWISSVEENGDDARIHFGIIAQDLQDAFTAEGLDAGRYAMFISSTWTDDDGNEQTRLGVRYSELLAFIISAI